MSRSDQKLRNVLSIILGGMIGASVAACGSVPGAATLHRLTAPTSQKIILAPRTPITDARDSRTDPQQQ